MLFKLIKNELIKLIKKPKTKVMIVLYIIFTILVAGFSYISDLNDEKFNSPQKQIELLTRERARIETMDESYFKGKESSISTEEAKSFKQEQIDHIDAQIQMYKLQIENPNGWKETMKSEIEKNEERLQTGPLDESYRRGLEEKTLQLKYYIDNNISIKQANKFNAINFTIQYMDILGMVFLLVALAVFASDIVSGEYTPATMKFLVVQPVNRGKILISKFISVVIVSIALIIGVEAVAFLVIGLINGFGALNLPVLSATRYTLDGVASSSFTYTLKAIDGSSKIIPRIQLLAQGIGMQALFIACAIAFIFMISTLVSSSAISMAVSTIILIIIPIIAQQIRAITKVAHLFFTSYGSTIALAQGDLAIRYGNVNFTIGNSIAVFIISSIVFYLIAHFNFVKKDLTI